uniref:Uncharacterized protein n=1 Tax=Parascaris equorum TaxID=6256 RepID=A0A914S2J4_PAREQ
GVSIAKATVRTASGDSKQCSYEATQSNRTLIPSLEVLFVAHSIALCVSHYPLSRISNDSTSCCSTRHRSSCLRYVLFAV